MSAPDKQRIFLISGPSGAGLSTALAALEDLDFEVIDNLPLHFWPTLLNEGALTKPLALSIDSRNRDFSVDGVLKELARLKQTDAQIGLIFLDAEDSVLLRRYSETRRRHPMARGASPNVGIEAERALLGPLRETADEFVDTSDLSPHDLGREIRRIAGQLEQGALSVEVMSFSYKRPLPSGVDMVIDCRFLENPHWDEALRPLTGQDQGVQDFLAGDKNYAAFIEKLSALIDLLLPAHHEEGKAHFTIGFGCTGGRHRSVAMTEVIASHIRQQGWRVSTRHRELDGVTKNKSQTGAKRT